MSDDNRLYGLLPAFIRYRDQAEGGPLEALTEALTAPLTALRADLSNLYDQWFIETCAPWAVSLLGDLHGLEALEDAPSPRIRAYVANTIARRALVGSRGALERLAADVSGWPCRVRPWTDTAAVLTTSLSSRHARTPETDNPHPTAGATERLPSDGLGPVGARITSATRPGEAEDLVVQAGAAATLGFELFRAQAYPVTDAEPRRLGPGLYSFDCLGLERPLFWTPRTPLDPFTPCLPEHLPRPVQPDDLARRLTDHQADWDDAPAFEIRIDGQRLGAQALCVADLSGADDPFPERPSAHGPRAAVDPRTGRFAIAGAGEGAEILVSYAYGGLIDLGGGPYPRAPSAEDQPPLALVATQADPNGQIVGSVLAGLELWAQGEGDGVVEILDSRTYRGGFTIHMAALDPGAHAPPRRLVIRARPGERPCLEGPFRIHSADQAFVLSLEGLQLLGPLEIEGAGQVRLVDCTLLVAPAKDHAPDAADRPALRVAAEAFVEVVVSASIVQGARLPSSARLRARDSLIVGPVSGPGLAVGPLAQLARCTLTGPAHLTALEAVDSLFAGPLTVAQVETGGLDHCYAAVADRTPRRRAAHAGAPPTFASQRLGAPDVAALVPPAGPLSQAASNGLEIGVYNRLAVAARLAALKAAIEDEAPAEWRPQVVFAS